MIPVLGRPGPGSDPEYRQRVDRRLREERVVWFTAVDGNGVPQPNPVWFLWTDGGFVVYSSTTARRLRHIRARPAVSLHFDGGLLGRDIVVFSGRARVEPHRPPADQLPGYLAKYREAMLQVFGGVVEFTRSHPVPIRVDVDGVRGR